MRRDCRRLLTFMLLVLALAVPTTGAAQTTYVQFEGRVQWISGAVMSLALNDGPAVAIDLGRVPQGDYIGLGQGDWVVVLGEVSPDRRRIFGTRIGRAYGGTQAP